MLTLPLNHLVLAGAVLFLAGCLTPFFWAISYMTFMSWWKTRRRSNRRRVFFK
jgi:hypothetical protein